MVIVSVVAYGFNSQLIKLFDIEIKKCGTNSILKS